MSKFPKIEHKCFECGGSGEVDVSYHGSPIYKPCPDCKGMENVKYYRDMTPNEKFDYLLEKITNKE